MSCNLIFGLVWSMARQFYFRGFQNVPYHSPLKTGVISTVSYYVINLSNLESYLFHFVNRLHEEESRNRLINEEKKKPHDTRSNGTLSTGNNGTLKRRVPSYVSKNVRNSFCIFCRVLFMLDLMKLLRNCLRKLGLPFFRQLELFHTRDTIVGFKPAEYFTEQV